MASKAERHAEAFQLLMKASQGEVLDSSDEDEGPKNADAQSGILCSAIFEALLPDGDLNGEFMELLGLGIIAQITGGGDSD